MLNRKNRKKQLGNLDFPGFFCVDGKKEEKDDRFVSKKFSAPKTQKVPVFEGVKG